MLADGSPQPDSQADQICHHDMLSRNRTPTRTPEGGKEEALLSAGRPSGPWICRVGASVHAHLARDSGGKGVSAWKTRSGGCGLALLCLLLEPRGSGGGQPACGTASPRKLLGLTEQLTHTCMKGQTDGRHSNGDAQHRPGARLINVSRCSWRSCASTASQAQGRTDTALHGLGPTRAT